MKKSTPQPRPVPPPAPPNNRTLPWLVGILVLAAALRFIGLDRVPPGANQDEAERAYEAYCLRMAGKDHWGKPWPVFFRAFGAADYPPGPYIYALIPVQAIFGMNIWSTRLPAALLGTLNVLFVYLLVSALYGRRTGLFAALLLAVNPWHVHLSRMAFEVSLCPPLITLSLWLIARRPRQGTARPARGGWTRLAAFAGAGLAIGTAAWTYNALRIVVPLLVIGAALLYMGAVRRWLRQPADRHALAALAISFLVALSPFIWATIKTPEEAWGRAAAISVFKTSATLVDAISTMVRVYFLQFSPRFLFIVGDQVQSVPGCGLLHYVCALLLPLGLVRVIRRWRTERFGLLVVWWILVAPIPAAGTAQFTPNCLRDAGVLPAYQILAAVGLDGLLQVAARRSRHTLRVCAGGVSLLFAANMTYFGYQLLKRYPAERARYFQVDWAQAMPEIRRLEPEYDAVLLTPRGGNQLYMLYLFWGQVDPREYFQLPRQVRKGEQWDNTTQLGKVSFAPAELLPQLAARVPAAGKILVAERPGIRVPGPVLKRFYAPSGEESLILYTVEVAKLPRR